MKESFSPLASENAPELAPNPEDSGFTFSASVPSTPALGGPTQPACTAAMRELSVAEVGSLSCLRGLQPARASSVCSGSSRLGPSLLPPPAPP